MDFAGALGLSAAPALAGGTNFAFAGARTSGGEPPPSLTTQVGLFLGGTSGVAPASFLYVVAGGGNNGRAALEAINGGANILATAGATAYQYAADVGNIVDGLQAAGAKNILVWNTPDLGLTPAIRSKGAGAAVLGTTVSGLMNGALAQRLQGEAGVQIFDLFSFINQAVANPAAYGLSNVTDACLLGNCNASEQLFWDGIHPTARGHELLAQAVYAQVVPEPETYLLFAVGLAALAWKGRRRAR
jgi:outer membrane lipase/esterase